MRENKQEILLDSGTNELEIVTYTVGQNIFSINVMKVREIIHPMEVTPVPESHKAVEGVVQVRGEILPVINLAVVLNAIPTKNIADSRFIIAELNQMKVVFRVDEVHRIQRISWTQIEEPSSLSMGLEETTAGIVKLNDKIVLMLDYEKLVYDISPSSGFGKKDVEGIAKEERRSTKSIFIAEDSAMLRQLLDETLRMAGYTNLHFFNNGQEALDHIETLAKAKGKDMFKTVDLLITDIEMPKMDGHTLTRRIKENDVAKELPIVIFSSLISEELHHKGETVGADAQVSKPEIRKLIGLLDELTF